MQNTFADYYAQLGCQPDVTEQAIDAAMMNIAKQLKASESAPDPSLVSNIKAAYEVLKNPVSRAEYDQEYLRHQQQQAAQQPSSLEAVEELVDELQEDSAESSLADVSEVAIPEIDEPQGDGVEETPVDSSKFENDAENRYQLLLMFYEKRRADMKMPGIGAGGLTEEVPYPNNVLEFHLWYFRERGWIERLEGGQLAITASGVDKIEELTRDYVAPS